jgi:glycosyltransferase involved in cell wall biosynthesis
VSDFVFAVPGSLDTPTGGYAYDRRIIAELALLGCHAHVLDLGNGFPHADATTRTAAQAMFGGAERGKPIVIDGLALGVLPDAAAAAAASRPLIALVHHPLALETGLSCSLAEALRTSERQALAHAHHVIVTSAATARILVADYDVLAERVAIVRPGVDRVVAARKEPREDITLLAVGSLVPRKGYDVLLAALAIVRELPWRLIIVGDAERDPETAAQLGAQIAKLDLGERVVLCGAVAENRLPEFYQRADLFVLASRFEGYGMAFADAIAHGLPVIGTTAGAIPDTVPARTAILVPPDDASALAAALRRLIVEPKERAHLSAAASAASVSLPTWRDAAEAFLRVIRAAA